MWSTWWPSASQASYSLSGIGPPSACSIGRRGFVGALEVLQIWMAGRHARWIDFAMDALGFCIGVGVDLIVSRVRDQLTAQ